MDNLKISYQYLSLHKNNKVQKGFSFCEGSLKRTMNHGVTLALTEKPDFNKENLQEKRIKLLGWPKDPYRCQTEGFFAGLTNKTIYCPVFTPVNFNSIIMQLTELRRFFLNNIFFTRQNL